MTSRIQARVRRASLIALLCSCAAFAQTTIVDDSFSDGTRTGQNPPPSIAWFVNTGSGLTATASTAGLQLNNPSSRLVVGYFTAAGSPVALPVGQSVTLELTFVSDVAPASVTNGFNLALMNSGATRVTADFSGTSNAAFTSYDGYGSKTSGLGSTSGSAVTLRRRNAATRSTSLMSTSGDWTTLATGSGTTPVGAAAIVYVATLTIANNGSTASVSYSIKTSDGVTTLQSVSGNDTTAAGVLSSFDAIALYFQTGEFPSGTFTLQRARVVTSGGTTTPVAPSFTVQPASQTANVGGNVTFTAAASGTPAPTYQWQKDGGAIAGATTTALTLTNVQTGDAGNYTVIAANTAGSALSAPATLTVLAAGTAPTITTQPSSQTVNAGDTASFSVAASGTAPLTYQWRKAGNAISGATNATLTLANVQTSAAGDYAVVVTNAAGTATSDIATLTVNAAPTITAQPLSIATTAGSNVSFTVVATGSPAPVYQWQKDGAPIAGATTTTLSLTNAQFGDAGSYAVVVSNAVGAVTSSAATLTVAAPSPLSRYNLAGFATLGAGTTGGGVIAETDPAYVKVTTPLELANALIAAAKTAGAVKVIEIMNDLNLGWNEIGPAVQSLSSNPFRSHTTPKLHPVLIGTGVSLVDIKPKSGLTIFSANGATIRHANFNIKSTANIIVRNLKFDEMWEWDEATKGNYDSNDWDFITLSNGGAVTNVWIDHCTFTKAYDGIADMKAGTQYVTVSWCKYVGDDGATNANSFVRQQIAALEANRSSYAFYNFLRTNGFSVEDIVTIIQGHDKGHLMGSNSLDSQNATLSATFHHQWFANLWDRCVPRLRAGNVHNYNIYVDDSTVLMAKRLRDARAAAMTSSARNTLNNTYSFNPPINGSISTEGGALLLEKSVYLDCLWPLRNNQTDPSNAVYTGKILALDSRYVFHNADGSVVNVRGNSTDAGNPMGPFQAAIIPFSWNGFGTLPYSYRLDDPDDLPQMLAIGAGAGALSWSKENWLKTTYTDPATAPTIAVQPQAQTGVAGSSVTFSVAATGTDPLAYQWSKAGVPIAGATTNALTLSAIGAADVADYSVTVSNLVGVATSDSAHLTVLFPPTLVVQPQSQTATVGDTVTLAVAATGTAPLSFQWSKDGSPLPGATTDTLILGNVTTVAAGDYRAGVTNVAGTAASAVATLTVNKAVAAIALSGLTVPYDGMPKSATATTTPAGLNVVVTYDGSETAPTDSGTYAVAAAVVDADYMGSANAELTIQRATASITFGGLQQVYDGASKAVTATPTPAGLPVLVTYNGVTTPPSDAGTYAVHAAIDTRNYTGAADGILQVSPAPATIALSPLQQRYDGTARIVNATTAPVGLAVSVAYDGSATAPVLPGTYGIAAVITNPNYAGTATGTLTVTATALVKHAPNINGALDGAVQVALAEDTTMAGAATISEDLLVVGTPRTDVNGHAAFVAVRDGEGAIDPSGYSVTLRGDAVVRYLVRRVDAPTWPVIAPPAEPHGTRALLLNNAGSSVGDWAMVRDVTVNSGYGQLTLPPGSFGNISINGATLVLGIADASEPARYDLQSVAVTNGRIAVVGPVVMTVANGFRSSGAVGAPGQSDRLQLYVAAGPVIVSGTGKLYGNVIAPNSTVSAEGSSSIVGTMVSDRLAISTGAAVTDLRP